MLFDHVFRSCMYYIQCFVAFEEMTIQTHVNMSVMVLRGISTYTYLSGSHINYVYTYIYNIFISPEDINRSLSTKYKYDNK